jgi:two-component system LytT family response regulator
MKELISNKIKRLVELEDVVLNISQAISKLIENQMSLEVHLQEIIKSNTVRTVAVNSASKIDFIPVDDIIYCSADSSYTKIMLLENNDLFVTKSMNEFEKKLSNFSFFRISKSFLINLRNVHSFNKKSNQVLMKNQTVLEVSRRKKAEFMTAILNK